MLLFGCEKGFPEGPKGYLKAPLRPPIDHNGIMVV
jgi:hypothetical protein